MGTEVQPLHISEEKMEEIKLFCDVASANGSSLTLKDLIALSSLELTEEQLESGWECLPKMEEYGLEHGVIFGRNAIGTNWREVEIENCDRRSWANSNLQYAERFASICRSDNIRVFSVSGSTSYLSVSKSDDLDIFCITSKDSLWLSLFRFLLLARAFRLFVRSSPWLCLSYVVDETYALREFTKPQDALFARDAIVTKVILGKDYYAQLLKRSGWMGKYYPSLYEGLVGGVEEGRLDESKASSLLRIANLFLFYTVGNYVRIKSHLLDRRYTKEGKISSLFRARIGITHCVYESASYVQLRKMYSSLDHIRY